MIVLRTLCANAAGRLTDTAVADLRTHCVLAAAACARPAATFQSVVQPSSNFEIFQHIQLEQQQGSYRVGYYVF